MPFYINFTGISLNIYCSFLLLRCIAFDCKTIILSFCTDENAFIQCYQNLTTIRKIAIKLSSEMLQIHLDLSFSFSLALEMVYCVMFGNSICTILHGVFFFVFMLLIFIFFSVIKIRKDNIDL